MQVHHARRLAQQVVVQRREIDAALLQLREHRVDLVLGQHEVAHEHRRVHPDLQELDVRAEREPRLERHAARRDL